MTIAIVRSRALIDMSAPPVSVEVHLGNGLPAFSIVGLAEAEVRESRERVRAALLHCGFDFPNRRLTVNLAPADLPKDSGRFDLPIAIGVLAASGQLPSDRLDALEFVGELSLTGELRPVRGALALAASVARDARLGSLVLPAASAPEAARVRGLRILAADSLTTLASQLRGESAFERIEPVPGQLAPPGTVAPGRRDLGRVKGHRDARRALEVAAAGRHSLLMSGPPGSGKSLLASCLPDILAPMDEDEALACAAIASLAGRFDASQWSRRPFRAPHHSASAAALVGGGSPPRPGEISLAHHGVLFLDELPEFARPVLEALREPLETRRITLSRAARQAEFPADFQLAAAMNPCPCGYHGDDRCRCSADQVQRYRRRISGPLLDRIDLRVDVKPVSEEVLTSSRPVEASAPVAVRVAAAAARQRARQSEANAALEPGSLERHCPLDGPARALLNHAAARYRWSSRGLHRVLRVARTIADLADRDPIGETEIAEAISYRQGPG
jgi:magnesium chelatase family protein